MDKARLWERYKKYLWHSPEIGMMLDISRMNFDDGFFLKMEPHIQKAYEQMEKLEQGAIANPDENRMVGHYWLRNPTIAPNAEIRDAIEKSISAVRSFTEQIHSATVKPEKAQKFSHFLLIGIGGSALGPQLVADALGNTGDPMKAFFIDNTDPDGIDRVLAEIGPALSETLTIVISKSGGTQETRNGMLETKAAYTRAGLNFAFHAVAITGEGSQLSRLASEEGWLKQIPMWDWIGGRTSETSAVGLLPAALQGIDIDLFLSGAQKCDILTRSKKTAENPAALLALMWYHATDGRGMKDMVILPYKDRLILFSRYLQQLVMESLGKKHNLSGIEVHQGINVFGNKGSTDQHAYVQQLRDGLDNCFTTFIEVLQDRSKESIAVEENATSGDYLHGFMHGTREALSQNGRESITLSINSLNALTLGALIALYERSVGLYASLIGINAYHQPGVEAGKKAASKIIGLQKEILDYLKQNKQAAKTAIQVAAAIGQPDEVESVFKILLHAAGNRKEIKMEKLIPIHSSQFVHSSDSTEKE